MASSIISSFMAMISCWRWKLASTAAVALGFICAFTPAITLAVRPMASMAVAFAAIDVACMPIAETCVTMPCNRVRLVRT